MVRFREHRGGLAESLATTVHVPDETTLISYVKGLLSAWEVMVSDERVKIEPYGGDDERIGWKDVQIVSVEGYGVIGFVEMFANPPLREGGSEMSNVVLPCTICLQDATRSVDAPPLILQVCDHPQCVREAEAVAKAAEAAVRDWFQKYR